MPAIKNFTDQSRYCHAEHSEASLCPSRETLRGVYPERSEWAQGDKTLPILVVKNHNSSHPRIAQDWKDNYDQLVIVKRPLEVAVANARDSSGHSTAGTIYAKQVAD
jgi:hypothetical protein